MTARDKAAELYSKMYEETPLTGSIIHLNKLKKCAKECALITANELRSETCLYFSDRKSYWDQVIREIEKINE
jgi:hypothetical protein